MRRVDNQEFRYADPYASEPSSGQGAKGRFVDSSSSRGGQPQQRVRSRRGSRSQANPQPRTGASAARAHSGAAGQRIARVAIAICIAVALLLIGYFGARLAMGGFAQPQTQEQTTEQQEAAYQSPYTWSNLDRSTGRYVYKVGGKALSRTGIDVSENQGDIDWYEVANDDIDFAVVRLGYRGTSSAGKIVLDDKFEANINGAQNAGLDTGVYFFSQATTVAEAQEEADFVLQNLGGCQLEYPIVYDCEEIAAGAGSSRTSGMSADEMTACAKAFCARVEQAGYTAMIYGNSADLSRYTLSNLSSYDVWYAEYGVPVPSIKHDFVIWQYSNNGSVAGINAAVDLDIDLTQAYNVAKGH